MDADETPYPLPSTPDTAAIVDEFAAQYTDLDPVQRATLAYAMVMLATADRLANQAAEAGDYVTDNRGNQTVHPGHREARYLRREAVRMLGLIGAGDASSEAGRSLARRRWGG